MGSKDQLQAADGRDAGEPGAVAGERSDAEENLGRVRRHRDVLKHAGRKRNPGEDRELQEHAEDHQGDAGGRRQQDAQGAGSHACDAAVLAAHPPRHRPPAQG